LGTNSKNNNDDDDDNDDDDWGDDWDEVEYGSSSTKSNNELKALHQQSAKLSKKEPEERDLFIPIFALVSLGGLVGAYAYETFRLYSNGELYLPF
jgi:hypothetical protein